MNIFYFYLQIFGRTYMQIDLLNSYEGSCERFQIDTFELYCGRSNNQIPLL